jgi:hypothetical protein
MSTAPPSMSMFIPLTIRRTGGRPRIVPPAGMVPSKDDDVDPRVLKAIARAWSWRRKLESGEATTIGDIAQADGVTDRFVSRMIRLAWLAPAVLDRLLVQRQAPAMAIRELAIAADLPWGEQDGVVFRV